MSGEIVNQKSRLNAASEILEMLGCPAPHSEEECQKIINFKEEYFDNNKIPSVEAAGIRAERGTLGFFAGIQEIANESKGNRKG